MYSQQNRAWFACVRGLAIVLLFCIGGAPFAAAGQTTTTYSLFIEADDTRLDVGIYGYASTRVNPTTYNVLVTGQEDRTALMTLEDDVLTDEFGGTITLTLQSTNETVTMYVNADGSYELFDSSNTKLAQWAYDEEVGDFVFSSSSELVDSAAAYVLFAVLGDAEFSAIGSDVQAFILIPAVLAWCIVQCNCCADHYQDILDGVIPANTPEPRCCGRCFGNTCSVFGLL